MSEIQERMLDTLEKISDKVHTIDKNQIQEQLKTQQNYENIKKLSNEHSRMNDLLADHIKRTNILEEKSNTCQIECDSRAKQIDEALTPIRFAKNSSKFILWIGGISAAVFGIIKLLVYFKLMGT